VGEGDAAAAVLGELERFDVSEHLALQTRVLKARVRRCKRAKNVAGRDAPFDALQAALCASDAL
jgi:hypothetical protein